MHHLDHVARVPTGRGRGHANSNKRRRLFRRSVGARFTRSASASPFRVIVLGDERVRRGGRRLVERRGDRGVYVRERERVFLPGEIASLADGVEPIRKRVQEILRREERVAIRGVIDDLEIVIENVAVAGRRRVFRRGRTPTSFRGASRGGGRLGRFLSFGVSVGEGRRAGRVDRSFARPHASHRRHERVAARGRFGACERDGSRSGNGRRSGSGRRGHFRGGGGGDRADVFRPNRRPRGRRFHRLAGFCGTRSPRVPRRVRLDRRRRRHRRRRRRHRHRRLCHRLRRHRRLVRCEVMSPQIISAFVREGSLGLLDAPRTVSIVVDVSEVLAQRRGGFGGFLFPP